MQNYCKISTAEVQSVSSCLMLNENVLPSSGGIPVRSLDLTKPGVESSTLCIPAVLYVQIKHIRPSIVLNNFSRCI